VSLPHIALSFHTGARFRSASSALGQAGGPALADGRSEVDEVALLRVVRRLALRRARRLARRLAAVELGDDLGADPVELLLGEDAEERPGEVERVEDRPGLVGACRRACGGNGIGAMGIIGGRSRAGKERGDAPWLMNCRSNLSRNSSASLSSDESASSPTTAFIAAASRPIAYLAY
jgi:hypothetical protein